MNNITDLFITIQENPVLLILYTLYTVSLKGLSLWKAAKNSHKYWFIGLLIVNFFGIPELLYIFVFSKNKIVLPDLKILKLKAKK